MKFEQVKQILLEIKNLSNEKSFERLENNFNHLFCKKKLAARKWLQAKIISTNNRLTRVFDNSLATYRR